MNHYLYDLPGKNSWPRYLSSLAVMIGFTILGSIFYAAAGILTVLSDKDQESYFDLATGAFAGLDPVLDLTYLMLVYVFWLAGIWISIRFIHKRTLTSLVTPRRRINWRTVFWSFGIYFLLTALSLGIDALIYPHNYMLNRPDPLHFLTLFVVVLLLVPIQTTVEELFFRGFLLQWMAKKIRSIAVLSVLMAIIFGSLHFANPEMGRSAIWVGLSYLFMGFMLTFISVKMGTLELSIGAHMANNMLLFWFFADEKSVGGVLPAPFRVLDSDPVTSFLWEVCVMVLFYILSVRKFKRNNTEAKTKEIQAG
ncbi:CPBP family intramembrane metalloprotease [Metabacillus sp. GX 13764]|uniref:CPBP family intramembrane glutamic endopeptidase n=1 Tax=Metabacillus kandeliae TaxID=2900151 RepID=UPI001E46A57D|nr:type II CAAX endopeptidase family protein [Metabacillus kandeliae]MCD7034028.1 CPBP family intramembrane metalloprotease [Metabacillus kandeliae]